MSIRNKGFVFAMESDEEIEATDDSSIVEASDAVNEIEDQADDIADITDASVDAETDAGTLGEIKEILEESAEKGEGIDETAAEIAEVAVEAIRARLGIRRSKKVFPATESFGSTNSRLVSTQIAIEGIGDTIADIWRAIKKAFQEAWAWIVEFYKKFFDGLTKLENAHKDVASKLSAVKNTAQGQTIDSSGLAKMFVIDGKVDTTNIGKILQNHLKMIEFSNKSLITIAEVSDIAKSLSEDKEFDAKAAADRFIESFSSKISGAGTVDKKDKQTIITSPVLLHGNKIKYTLSKDDNGVISYDSSNVEDKYSGDTKLTVSTESYLKKILEQVDDIIKAVKLSKEAQNVLKKSNDEFVKALDKLIGDSDKKEVKTQVLKSYFSSGKKMMKDIPVTITASSIKAGNAGLQYITASLKVKDSK